MLGAQTEGMIGYVLEQELGNLLPFEVPFATLLTMIEVDPADPAFEDPTKFVGPSTTRARPTQLAAEKGWVFKQDGDRWRRVVPSPEPKRIFEIRPIRWLLDKDVVVICAGGGGVPTMYEPDGDADPGRRRGRHRQGPGQRAAGPRGGRRPVRHGHRCRRRLRRTGARPSSASSSGSRRRELRELPFAAGSMGPKVEAAIRFVERTGKRAAIGGLDEIEAIVAGDGRAPRWWPA